MSQSNKHLDKLAQSYISGGEFEAGLYANAMGFPLDKALLTEVIDRAEKMHNEIEEIPSAWKQMVA